MVRYYVTLNMLSYSKTISGLSEQYENHNDVNDFLLWEVIKIEVRESSIVYAKQTKWVWRIKKQT